MPNLNLLWGNATLFFPHTHLPHREIVADMLTSSDRHFPLSLCGCKVFSLPTLLRNKHACLHVCTLASYRASQMLKRFQHGKPARLDKPLWKLWTRAGESTLSSTHVPYHPSITAPQIQPSRDRTNSQCKQLYVRRSGGIIELPLVRTKMLSPALEFLLSCVWYDGWEFIRINTNTFCFRSALCALQMGLPEAAV